GRGNQLVTGYCVGLSATPPTSRKLKEVAELLDREPLLTPDMLELTRWMAGRYLAGWGQVLETVVPAGVKSKAGTREVVYYRPRPDLPANLEELRLPRKQREVLTALLSAGEPLTGADLAKRAKCGTAPSHGLRDKQLIHAVRERTSAEVIPAAPAEREEDLTLNAEQQKALDCILDVARTGQHQTLLLHGVTGSGKTEVYIRAIREVLSYGRQAIMLVPEISLTPQTIRRFQRRFSRIAVLHSHLSDADRHRQWQAIASGEIEVVVGARSAVFAPTPQLGLIVIDEEHETTFKQQTTPRYHARE